MMIIKNYFVQSTCPLFQIQSHVKRVPQCIKFVSQGKKWHDRNEFHYHNLLPMYMRLYNDAILVFSQHSLFRRSNELPKYLFAK